MADNKIVENYKALISEISTLSSNSEGVPELLVVSKYQSVESIKLLYEHTGHADFGENYIQELFSKSEKLPRTIRWHFIGRLQRNKAKTLLSIPNLEVFETLDSVKMAKLLDELCIERCSPLKVMIQVKTSIEESKNGIDVSNVLDLFEFVMLECKNLSFYGLMTMGNSDPSLTSNFNCFETMSELKRKITELYLCKYRGNPSFECKLSMGTSRDMDIAIKNKSNQIRIGNAIFGKRKDSSI
ncbi:hypothetical protein FG386_003465 [Cryptosporidium ryanae]|uniref:uncharacterized protein n=1 Tax=Cryptosporidium ryanae TaxID=515981 RepID=UPI00351A1940|nr:hypothetical protein FG386_003465 [Cryptosporidium ryanae]